MAVSVVVRWFLSVRIPRGAHTFYLGGVALFLFLLQALTGTLLALYYRPSPEAAYDSIIFIMTAVDFGWLVRGVHHWSANLMIAVVFLHMLRTFWHAVYKGPREMTWVFGGLLLIVTLGFGFTGYLLPWDQRAFWATTVGTDIAGAVPLVGDFLRQFLRDGAEVTGLTLTRFFGVHVLVLPVFLAAVLGTHLYLVHHHGIADPPHAPTPASAGPTLSDHSERKSLLPFVPNYVLGELSAWYIVIGIVVALVTLAPAGLEDKADSLLTPAHVKPEWYFLAVFEFLKVAGGLRDWLGPQAPLLIGIGLPGLLVAALVLLPFLDHNPSRLPRQRPVALSLAVLILAAMVTLTFLGQGS
jgi:quinol-cytochrome oxidoreductase complex cytochrome b subunit